MSQTFNVEEVVDRVGTSAPCPDCCDINFEAYFGVGRYHETIPSILVQNATTNEATCPFCRLLMRGARQFTHPNRVIPRRNTEPVGFFFEREYREPMCDETGVFIPGGGVMRVRLRPPPSPLPMDMAADFVLCPLFTGDADDLQHSTQIVLADQIDFNLCRRWLRDCQGQHLEPCRLRTSNTLDLPNGFRVIDVVEDCIVLAPPNCQYIALSYVWGQVNTLSLELDTVSAFETQGALAEFSGHMSRTILDAIEVVKSMGERYLWVDRLCIVQNSSDKGVQIGAMDHIYSTALLTIVVADGMDAESGIRGVHPGSRELHQITEEVWPDINLFVSTPSPIDPAESIWASRGWTCQEQVLSRRLLIFTKGQVVWQCPSRLLCEDTEARNKVNPIPRLQQISRNPQAHRSRLQLGSQPQPLIRPEIFSQYISIVQDYSKRRLTFEDDVLLAFEGFGSILQRQFNSKSIAGLPEAYLDQSLLWLPMERQERRKGSKDAFPSWSWAGWKGRIRYDEVEESAIERVVPALKWHLKQPNEDAMPINDSGIGIDENRFGSGKSTNTFLWVPLFELLSGRLGYFPKVQIDSQNGALLQFWTSCSFFDISVRDTPAAMGQYEVSLNKPIKLHINLQMSRGGNLAGYMILNEGPLEIHPDRHEFIVLSEAQATGFNPVTWACKYSDRCDMYNVMLVEWDDEHKIAFRLGLGRVLKKAWVGSRPTVKFITLG